jgi:hypothetical protein
MTKSFDELFAPKTMSLDELFAAIRPPPLLPLNYPPSDNSDFMSPSFAGGVNAPHPIPLNQFLPRTTPAPHDTYNFGDPGSGWPGNGNDQALASIDSDDLLNHILARQAKGLPPTPDYSSATVPDTARASDEALASIDSDDLLNRILARQAKGLPPLPDYSTTTQTLPPGWLLAGVQPAPLQQLNYASSPRNPPNDAGLNPSDDWQKRGRNTAAMALGTSYPKDGPIAAAANQRLNSGGEAVYVCLHACVLGREASLDRRGGETRVPWSDVR